MAEIADTATNNLLYTIHVIPRFQDMDLSYVLEVKSLRCRHRNKNNLHVLTIRVLFIRHVFYIFIVIL